MQAGAHHRWTHDLQVQVAYLGPAFRGWAAQAGCREAAAASIGAAGALGNTHVAGNQLSALPLQAQGSCRTQGSHQQQQESEQQQQQQQPATASSPEGLLDAARGADSSTSPGPQVGTDPHDSRGSSSACAGHLLSVEGVLGAALAGLAGGKAPRLSVGGRTDKGVSAAAQVGEATAANAIKAPPPHLL